MSYIDNMVNINEREITEDLIRALMYYSFLKNWDMKTILDIFCELGIPKEIVYDLLKLNKEFYDD